MKSLVTALALFFVAGSAHAYKDGTYTCKHTNYPDLEANVYEFRTVSVADGLTAHYVNATLHYYNTEENRDRSPQTATLSGFATRSNSTSLGEVFMLGSLRFQFDGDKLINCQTNENQGFLR